MIGEDLTVHGTETDQLRQQLLQAQRLSSMGALASSVAHEFNNILTTIINYAKLGLRSAGDEAARTEALEKILKGSQRAATIVNSREFRPMEIFLFVAFVYLCCGVAASVIGAWLERTMATEDLRLEASSAA